MIKVSRENSSNSSWFRISDGEASKLTGIRSLRPYLFLERRQNRASIQRALTSRNLFPHWHARNFFLFFLLLVPPYIAELAKAQKLRLRARSDRKSWSDFRISIAIYYLCNRGWRFNTNTIDGTAAHRHRGDNILIYVSQPAPLSHSRVFLFGKGYPRPHATFPPSHRRIDFPLSLHLFLSPWDINLSLSSSSILRKRG